MSYSSLTMVVDNRAREGFRSCWGLSMLLEGEHTLLFDAGPSGDDLLHNLSLCGREPSDIDIFFLSHSHMDHYGGFRALQDAGFSGEVILSDYVPRSLVGGIAKGEGVQPLDNGLTAIRLSADGLHEQSLLAETPLGLLLLVGCSHPGLERIWNVACTVETPYAVVGGFHDSRPFDDLSRARLLGPCHCTQMLKAFRERFPSTFVDLAAGDRLVFSEEPA
jgi:7,8-dihydropterin-6-yl-methyl-4-(beta-D-ribofuranosyl)aminobenzene 5'-phosphate synthase